jgi:hypothetical protein
LLIVHLVDDDPFEFHVDGHSKLLFGTTGTFVKGAL